MNNEWGFEMGRVGFRKCKKKTPTLRRVSDMEK